MPELTVTMVPARRASRCGVKASMTRMVPSRFVATVVSAAAACAGSRRSSVSSTPDIVTTTSRSGCARRTSSRARRMESGSVTSMRTVSMPSWGWGLRPPAMTVLPASANRCASPRPMPEVPPAMKTVRLVISTLTSLWLWC